MPSVFNLNGLWEQNLTNIFNHGSKTEVGIILRSWVKHKLEDFTSLLEFNIEDFQPTGSLSTYKEKPDSEEETKMPATPLREMYNLTRYILCERAQYDYGYVMATSPENLLDSLLRRGFSQKPQAHHILGRTQQS